jgi:hypothetical protein
MNEVKSPFEEGSGYTISRKPLKGGGEVRKAYDEKGNQIAYESTTGFWSRTERREDGQISHYYNSEDEWYIRHYIGDELISVNDKLGHWEVIVNTSHLLTYNGELCEYRFGQDMFQGNYDDLLDYFADFKPVMCSHIRTRLNEHRCELRLQFERERQAREHAPSLWERFLTWLVKVAQ